MRMLMKSEWAGGLRAMVGPVGVLKWLIKLIGGHVMVELCSRHFLECPADEREVGDRSVVAKISSDQANIFQDGSEGGRFKLMGREPSRSDALTRSMM